MMVNPHILVGSYAEEFNCDKYNATAITLYRHTFTFDTVDNIERPGLCWLVWVADIQVPSSKNELCFVVDWSSEVLRAFLNIERGTSEAFHAVGP